MNHETGTLIHNRRNALLVPPGETLIYQKNCRCIPIKLRYEEINYRGRALQGHIRTGRGSTFAAPCSPGVLPAYRPLRPRRASNPKSPKSRSNPERKKELASIISIARHQEGHVSKTREPEGISSSRVRGNRIETVTFLPHLSGLRLLIKDTSLHNITHSSDSIGLTS